MRLNPFLAAVIFILIPVFAARPMTSLFAKQLGASIIEIGMITACFSFLPLLLAIFAGRYIDRYGERMPLAIGSVGIFFSLCLPYLFPLIHVLYISQLLLGISQLLAILSIQNGVAKSSEGGSINSSIGSFSLFSSTGMLLGPLMGGYATEHFGFQMTYLLLAFVPLVSLILSYYVSGKDIVADSDKHKQNSSFKELIQISGLKSSLLVSMIVLSALDIFYVYFPLLAQSLGLSFSQIGWALAAQASANALVRIFMPRLVNNFGVTTILWIFMLIGAFGYGIIPFLHEFAAIFIFAFILGTGLGVTQPLTIILAYTFSPDGRSGEVLGVRLASNRLAQTIVPFAFAGISNFIGLGPIFLLNSFLLMGGAFIANNISKVKKI
ncbi:MFS transporter [Sporosarcina sp. 179-K 3D1 HS]|uniref:MFS transporter n=1 Tax=Sporosarcina sp. 179-K 3D1 HS TaxID=3232169 RepID=UPI0039A0DF1D